MSENITTKLLPYAFLNKSFQEYVAENSQPKNVNAGEAIFTEGKEADSIFFLLKGKVKLSTKQGKESIRGPSAMAFSQGYEQYNVSAEAVENAVILQVFLSPKQQDTLLCWEFTSRFFNHAPWILSIKNCEMFDYTPAANLLKLAQAFQLVNVNAGDLITKENNYERQFYVLLEGAASVYQGIINESSKPLTTINTLQTFGEAALLEDLPRTATIKMDSSGSLMSLDASQLETLNTESLPASCFVSRNELKEKTSAGSKILDIRPEKESQLSPLKGAILAPVDKGSNLPELIDGNSSYIIYSPYEQLNKLVYQLLCKKNSKVFILK